MLTTKKKIKITKELHKKVVELAESQGMTPDEMVQKIVEWYFEQFEK